MMRPKKGSDEYNMAKHVGASLSRVQNGLNVHSTNGTHMINFFGCLKCSWAGTPMCKHEIKVGGHHSNWICQDRVMYLKERYKAAGDVPKMYQQETLFALSHVMENMLKGWSEGEELDDQFKHIAKNVISLTDKMRRQDEGIKIQGEINVAHQDFKQMVEAEAKKIEERNNRTRPAEFKEEVRESKEQGT